MGQLKLSVESKIVEGYLHNTYSPLQNLQNSEGIIGDFTINNGLKWSLNYPLNIECQPSYDGTINLIINDDLNPPRIINTRFSKIENNRFKIINRNQTKQTNIYHTNLIDSETRLIRTTDTIPTLDLVDVPRFGCLKGGNYVFYITFADSDENETPVVCESGIVSIFHGTHTNIASISGTLLNEETDKSVKLKLNNIDVSFTKFYVYYSRETSDLNGQRSFEVVKITSSYDVKSKSQDLIINGFEETELVSEDHLNINYLTVSAVKTQAQVQNMLFFGNIQQDTTNYKTLQNLSYYIKVTLRQKTESIGWISSNYFSDSNGSEYYDPKNIYYNLGYWPEELYRLGVVYIMNDDTLSPVFNLRGCQFQKIGDCNLQESYVYNDSVFIPANSMLTGLLYENSMGVFKNPTETSANSVVDHRQSRVCPWYYHMDLSQVTDELARYGVKGYFFVRQKRIPFILCQGISIGVESKSKTPALYANSQYISESFVDGMYGMLGSNIITAPEDKMSSSGLLSLDAVVNPEIQSKIDGSTMLLQKVKSGEPIFGDYHCQYKLQDPTNESTLIPCTFVKENIPYKYVQDYGFSTRVGSELAVKEYGLWTDNVLRGIFTSFIGVCGKITPGCLYNIKTSSADGGNIREHMGIRGNDQSPFYAITNRYSLLEKQEVNAYRGDCYTCTVSLRLNRNFRDPDLPINDTIVNGECWKKNFRGDSTTAEEWAEINRADVNAVPLGIWVTYKCLSTYNLGLRSEDSADLSEMALIGNTKSFYPHRSKDRSSANRMSESVILNKGLSSTTSRKWNGIVQTVPYIKNQFDNRIMFSNVFTEENFRNGYRIFQGLSYKDVDRQYGAIVKLLPWGTNLFCVFEHGLGIIPINEKALIQTSTNQSIHMYGAGVIQNQISLISADFGSIWQESIIRTPLAIYGVDTYAKKIWRFSDSKGFEIISDMKIQRYLNEHLKLSESDKYPTISLKNVKTHYNNYKGDVMFTFYNDLEDEVWNFCFNERMNKWITRYSWTPLYSANIDNIFYSTDRNRTTILSYIYNNRNCTHGIRCYNNELHQNSTNKFYLSFEGNDFAPEKYEIDSIKWTYISENREFEVKQSSVDWIQIQQDESGWYLDIEYPEDVDKIPLNIFIKINCCFSSYTYQDVVGIINGDHPEKHLYHINGFYVHGRSGIFDELNYSDSILTNQILPTKWYDKQEPFEFEFVVNEFIGMHKIFDNLVIISNNVQPNQLEFSIIGDVYDFNKRGIFRYNEFNESEWASANERTIEDVVYKKSQSFDNCTIEWDNNQNNYWIKLSQPTINIKEYGRIKGNIHYKEDAWYITIDPIKYRNKYQYQNKPESVGNVQHTRLRDKFIKIRVKYSGEDLVIITALHTLLTISNS